MCTTYRSTPLQQGGVGPDTIFAIVVRNVSCFHHFSAVLVKRTGPATKSIVRTRTVFVSACKCVPQDGYDIHECPPMTTDEQLLTRQRNSQLSSSPQKTRSSART